MADALDTLLARSPVVGVFSPRVRPHPFGTALNALLLRRGFGAYELEMGAHPRDAWRAARATQPGTSLVFVEYAPGDYQLAGLLAAMLRWKARGCWVVLCRAPGPFRSPRQRLAYRALRLLADRELAVTDDLPGTLATWPEHALPPLSGLGRVWVRRTEPARVGAIVTMLRCPTCRGVLRLSGEGLACEGCRRIHPIADGIPVLLPQNARVQVEERRHAYEAGDAYNVGAEVNRAWLEIGLYKRDLVGRLVRGKTPRASIDIGCGDWGLHHDVAGAIGTELAISGDVSLKLVSHARSQAIAPGRVHHLVFSAEALPFRERLFDFVYCSEVLEHLEHPERALAEMARVAQGARCIFTVPNERITGKLETGHVQTFGFDDFLALVRRYAEVREARGVFLWRETDIRQTLVRPPLGWLRFAAYLALGERFPRRSLSILTDGILR